MRIQVLTLCKPLLNIFCKKLKMGWLPKKTGDICRNDIKKMRYFVAAFLLQQKLQVLLMGFEPEMARIRFAIRAETMASFVSLSAIPLLA